MVFVIPASLFDSTFVNCWHSSSKSLLGLRRSSLQRVKLYSGIHFEIGCHNRLSPYRSFLEDPVYGEVSRISNGQQKGDRTGTGKGFAQFQRSLHLSIYKGFLVSSSLSIQIWLLLFPRLVGVSLIMSLRRPGNLPRPHQPFSVSDQVLCELFRYVLSPCFIDDRA